jgi:collagen type III alpha
MSGGTTTPPLSDQSPTPPCQPVAPQPSPQAVLIEDRIHKTRRQVKGVDIIAGLLTLTVGALSYLFVTSLVDHWLVTGGLGFWWRFLLWAILVIAAGLYFVKALWPALVLKINPVYAARTIEQCKPTLKNSLINFLLLRSREDDLAPVIYQALEQRAASDLKEVHIETAVDRRPVLRLSYLLLAVVGVICLYLALSPKNAMTSAQRILWPWTNLRAPTRVTIENVRPGNTTAYHGDFVTVSADVKGLDQDEPVLLHYSTADGEMLNQVIPMTEENNAYGRQAKLPPDSRGLQQDYSYYISAGDFKTATYNIETQIPPLIVVDKIDYHYPPYTGIPDTSIQRQGDIRAIEGTQITIHATANQPIDRAEIDFSGAGVRGIRMISEDRTATGRFILRMSSSDPTRGEHDFYQLLFTDKNHRKNPRPIRYNIEVLRDLPPEVQIVDPQKDETNVPLDGKLLIRVRAEDPDYGLSRVAIRAKLKEQELNIPPLLDARPPEKSINGEIQLKYEFEPKKFNLKPGDRVAYQAEAEDNKDPPPNMTASGVQWIVVVAPENPQAKNDQQPHRAQRPGDKSSGDSSQDQKTTQQQNQKSQPEQSQDEQNQQQNSKQSKQGEKDKEQAKSGDKNENGQKGDGNQQGDKSDEGKKGEKGGDGGKGDKTNEGTKGENGGDGQKGDKSNEGMKGDKGENKTGSEKNKDNGQSKQDSQNNSSQSSPDQSQSANQGNSSQNGKAGEKSASTESGKNAQKSSGNQSGKAQEPIDPKADPGDAFQEILDHRQQEQQKNQSGNQQQNNPQTGEKQSAGNEQSGNQKPGEKQSAGDKQPPGEKQQTGANQGNKQQSGSQQQTGDNQTGEKQQTGANQGQKQPSDGQQQPGEKQPGDNQTAGQKQSAGEAQRAGSKQGDKQQQGEKQPDAKQPGEKQTAGDIQPGDKSAGEKQSAENKTAAEKQPAGSEKSGEQSKLTDQQQQQPGAGQGSQQPKPSPEAQGANKPREKQPGQQGQDQNNKPEEGQSPSISPKQSDSQSDSAGDRSGGGQKGGGQHAQKPGQGSPGSQAPADQGGSKSDQQGQGETGSKPGDQAQSRDSTGSTAKQQAPQGTNGQKQPGDKTSGAEQKQSAGSSSNQEQQKPSDGGKAYNQLGKANSKSGSGNPGSGGQEGGQTDAGPVPESQPSEADQANLDYARKQTELALEHLEDQLAKDKPDLLDRLGWTREQAQSFIDRWQQLRRAAEEKSPRGQDAKKQLDDALKSLGLRPGTTYLKHGGTKEDQMRDLRDSGRFAPPPDWAEQFREYTRGVANQGKAANGEQGAGNRK